MHTMQIKRKRSRKFQFYGYCDTQDQCMPVNSSLVVTCAGAIRRSPSKDPHRSPSPKTLVRSNPCSFDEQIAKIVMGEALEKSDVERYSRQLLLPQFGVQSQKKLRRGRVLVVGVGGLGCPAALYLAGAGVGTIGLLDRPQDVVEKSNLHRQIAHNEQRVGVNKVRSAEIAIAALNSAIKIEKHDEFVPFNAVDLAKKYDVILDCTDNVKSRYLVSDACAAAEVPLVSGSAIGLEGQLTVYCGSGDTPCYRCIFPRPPPPSCVGSCDSAGVLGPVPGIIGTLQALEALKLLGEIQRTTSLQRKLLLFDAADSAFRTVTLRQRVRDCVACGEGYRITVQSFDYDGFAEGVAEGGLEEDPTASTKQAVDAKFRITPEKLKYMRENSQTFRLIDVRPEQQFAMCHLDEAESHPLDALNMSQLYKTEQSRQVPTVFICRRGNASQQAVRAALKCGVTNVVDVIGGLQSWHYNVDKEFPLY